MEYSQVDKATAFVTKSVLCVVLNDSEGAEARVVVQLINKNDDGQFGEADAARVRTDFADLILATCNGLALHQLLTAKPPPSPADGPHAC